MSFKCATCGETVANTFCRCACQRDPQTQSERIAELEVQNANMQENLNDLEAELSHAWETCQKAVERGMKLEAENKRLERAWLALQKRASADRVVELEAENRRLREMTDDI